MPIKLDILAFAAHPDDVEISASGIMIKHKMKGLKTGIVDFTAGELGTRGSAELRAEESKLASQIMQLDARENLGLRDGFFEINEESLLKVIVSIRKYQPEIVLLNAPSDRHPDHGRAQDLQKRACFLAGLPKIVTEVNNKQQLPWRPKNMYAYIQDNFHEPYIIIFVSDYWELRMKSLMAYSSQFYNPESNDPQTPISTPEFLNFIEGRAMQLGRVVNAKKGEGLLTLKPIGTENLLDLL